MLKSNNNGPDMGDYSSKFKISEIPSSKDFILDGRWRLNFFALDITPGVWVPALAGASLSSKTTVSDPILNCFVFEN
jgi:hypothetical protein